MFVVRLLTSSNLFQPSITFEALCRWIGVHLVASQRLHSDPRLWNPATYLSLSTSHRHIHKTPCVCYALLSSTLRGLLLLLWFDLVIQKLDSVLEAMIPIPVVCERCFLEVESRGTYLRSLGLDFTCTGKRAVHFTHDCD